MKKDNSILPMVEKITFSYVEVVRSFSPDSATPSQDTKADLSGSKDGAGRLMAKYGRTLSFKKHH